MTSPPEPEPEAQTKHLAGRAPNDFDPRLLQGFAATATTVLRSHTANVDPETILRRLCGDAIAGIPAAGATILLLDHQIDRLRCVASLGRLGEEYLAAAEVDASDESNWFAAALKHDGPLLVDDIATWPAGSPLRTRAVEAGVASIWVAPLRTGDGEPLGTFSVWWAEPAVRTAELRWVFEEFATLAQMIVELHQAQWHRMAMIARERNRIAGELHDDSVQAMTAVSLRLQRLTHKVGPEHAPALDESRREVDAAIERLRHMMFSLHSDTLAEEGLVVSLAIYTETYVEPAGIITVIDGDEQLRLDEGVEALAFRLARGALLNVVKHANAAHAWVTVGMDSRTLEVRVVDDGVGFDPSAISLVDHPGHVGLAYAHSLAASVGGTYGISSVPGTGTEVTFRLPML